jgi:hypothetical protein
MLPVSVCFGIEKRDGSPKIKYSASFNSTGLAVPFGHQACDLAVSQPKWAGYFQ